MTKGIIGKKLGMTQIFNDKGQIVPVTVIQAGPCVIVMRKTVARDGYEAVQVGFVDPQGGKRASKPEQGHCEKHGVAPVRVLRELKVDATDTQKEGDSILAGQFEEKAKVNVTGISKGKGFAGVMKRHHFKGGRATHGSMFHRAPGSIGNEQVTVRNLEIAKVDAENNLLLVKGAVPGPKGGYVVIKQEA
jgi:large subunit ribosomal protein L3